MTTDVTTYNVELRDKDGNLKDYLTPFVNSIKWEWLRIGGCGRCSITIKKAYRAVSFDALDDIQIRTVSGATSKLVYRGYIANITPNLKIDQDIQLDVRGYFDLLKKLVVHDTGDTLAYPRSDAYASFVAEFNGADGLQDDYTAETGQTITTVGTAQLDTAQKSLGTASLLLDGNSDYGTVPDNANWNFGSGDFTVRCRIRIANLPGAGNFQHCVGQWDIANQESWRVSIVNSTGYKIRFGYTTDGATDVNVDSDAMTFAANTWYHISVSRRGTNLYMFLDGVSVKDTFDIGTTIFHDSTGLLSIGAYLNGGGAGGAYLDGWIDSVRIFKGIALATTAFTPPTVEHDLLVSETSMIAADIVGTFVVPNSSIQIGTIDEGSFDNDSIEFLTTVDSALRTLAEIAGDVEYGVDEDLVFFWRTESSTITHKFFIGNNVSTFQRRVSWDNLVNKIYLVGGDVAGTKYKRTAENTDSQAQYFLSEEILNNSSIITDSVADQYMGTILTDRSTPKYSMRAKIANTDIRLEDTIPMGLITFYDATYDRDTIEDSVGDIIGLAADGGSDITIGLTGDGGDNVTVGGTFTLQVDKVTYTLSETSGRFNIDLQLGDVITETSAKLKRLERSLASLTQY